MRVIVITGTPCTGKSTLALALKKALKFDLITDKELIVKLSTDYDTKRKCHVVDTDKLEAEFKKLKNKSKSECIIFDSHLSHHLPNNLVDFCIVVKCDLALLRSRLKSRDYSLSKIKENMDCEIFDICLNEAKENHHEVIVFSGKTTNPSDFRGLLTSIRKKFK